MALSPEFIRVFDVMTRSVSQWQAHHPERIVCLTEEPTETLYLLGEQDRIVGISGFTVRPKEARRDKPKVSAFTSAKIDRIVELEPDLVIGFSDRKCYSAFFISVEVTVTFGKIERF